MVVDNTNTTTGQEPSSVEDPVIRATGLKKYFPVQTGIFERMVGDQRYVKAVDGVDLSVKPRETLGIVGESGCGKTTLGRTLANLYEPTDGIVEFEGAPISSFPKKHIAKNVQVIFQDPRSALNPRKTAREIVGKPLSVHDIELEGSKTDRIVELFEEVGLQRSHLDRYPHEFSGGQRQRINIARALAVEPNLIIADEPTSALDASVQAKIINLLNSLQSQYGLAYVFISHDLSVIKHISDRVAVMYLGKIVEKGPVDDLFNQPHHPYTRGLLNSIPRIEGDTSVRRDAIQGNPPSAIDRPAGCPYHTRCPEYIGDECIESEPDLEAVQPDSRQQSACHWVGRSAEERETHESPQKPAESSND